MPTNFKEIFSCNICGSPSDRVPIYYGCNEISTKQKVALLFEIPGGDLKNNDDPKKFDFIKTIEKNQCNFEGMTNFWRYGMLRYIDEKHSELLKVILPELHNHGFISNYDSYYEFLQNSFLHEIYFTDVVKCRPRYKQCFEKTFQPFKHCANKFLKSELLSLERLKLVITFGDKTFYSLKQTNSINLMIDPRFSKSENLLMSGNKINTWHGEVHVVDDGIRCYYLIRSIHPSGAWVKQKQKMIELLSNAIKYCVLRIREETTC